MYRGAHIELTQREHEIFVLLARGLSQHEVADALGVSTSTVKNHTSRVYTKLRARNQTEAFVKLGWLRLPGEDDAEPYADGVRAAEDIMREERDALYESQIARFGR